MLWKSDSDGHMCTYIFELVCVHSDLELEASGLEPSGLIEDLINIGTYLAQLGWSCAYTAGNCTN